MRAAILALSILGFVSAAAADTHKVEPGSTAYQAVTLASFDSRIDTAARKYLKQYPPGAISRIVMMDSALPFDAVEYAATGKNGVLLLSALSHDDSELPLTSAYMGGVKLKLLGSVHRQTLPNSAARAMFGAFRVDSFYLVPANLLRGDPTISADFTKNRMGFMVNQSPWEVPDFMKKDTAPRPNPTPPVAAIKILIDREYPGFGIEPSL